MTKISTFQELNLSPELTKAITEMGFESPTPIQCETLPILLSDPTDFMGLAATGTGKTAAYGLPLLEKIDETVRDIQAIVLCPTRELAIQVTEQFNLMGKYKRIRAVPIYGGAGYAEQIRGLRGGAHIVVATPGRLIDHLDRGTIKLAKIKTIILDEADEMISMGFKEDIERVLELLPESTFNTWLFSATMSKAIRSVADRFLNEPKSVQVNKAEMLSGTVRQIFYKMQERDKPEILCKLIDQEEEFYGLIFCQTKALVVDLTQYLSERGHKVDSLHGDKDQKQRERTMNAFKERKVSILVCTDVACRGIDVKDLTHVVNYSIARELDSYVHRIGRTGRSGKTGTAISLVTNSHMPLVSRIEKMTGTPIERGVVPTLKDLAKTKVTRLLVNLKTVDAEPIPRVVSLMGDEWTETLESLTKEEIAARFLSLMKPEIAFIPKMEAPREERREGEEGGRDRRESRDDRRGRRAQAFGRTGGDDDRRERRGSFFKERDGGSFGGDRDRGGRGGFSRDGGGGRDRGRSFGGDRGGFSRGGDRDRGFSRGRDSRFEDSSGGDSRPSDSSGRPFRRFRQDRDSGGRF